MGCDLVVIGAGPTGLYATYYAGFRGLRVAVIDSLPESAALAVNTAVAARDPSARLFPGPFTETAA